MKKLVCIILVLIMSVMLGGCKTTATKNTQAFYDKVNESKSFLDLVAIDVCTAWKDASEYYHLSTEAINLKIEMVKQEQIENIKKINEIDKEINELFNKAKNETKAKSVTNALKQVMIAYSEYKESILKANEALSASGYVAISVLRYSLDEALRNLYVEL